MSDAIRVLVVDDTGLGTKMVEMLTGEGFVARSCDPEDLLVQLMTQEASAVVVAFDSPAGSCQPLLRIIRDQESLADICLVVLASKDVGAARLQALEAGADEYLTLPVAEPELKACIRAKLRRIREQQVLAKTRALGERPHSALESGSLRLDPKTYRVRRGDSELHLTLTEFRILFELLSQRGQVLSRDWLRRAALGNLNVTDRTIDVHMAALRKKLDSDAGRIQTVRGVGYRFS